jgi:hypothetical protein
MPNYWLDLDPLLQILLKPGSATVGMGHFLFLGSPLSLHPTAYDSAPVF